MAVITKKNEKLSCVVNELDANHTADKFKDIFPIGIKSSMKRRLNQVKHVQCLSLSSI